MDRALPRLSSIIGVARALITTVGVEQSVDILVEQFGWDQAFLALAHLEGVDAEQALYQAARSIDDVT